MKSFIQLFGQFDPKLYRSMTPAVLLSDAHDCHVDGKSPFWF